MINKERIILLAEEKLFTLLDKEYTDWNEDERSYAREEFDKRTAYRDSEL